MNIPTTRVLCMCSHFTAINRFKSTATNKTDELYHLHPQQEQYAREVKGETYNLLFFHFVVFALKKKKITELMVNFFTLLVQVLLHACFKREREKKKRKSLECGKVHVNELGIRDHSTSVVNEQINTRKI